MAQCVTLREWRAKAFQFISSQRRNLHSSGRLSKEYGAPAKQSQSVKEKLAAREFFLSVLSASATKRDAKQYLKSFQAPPDQLPVGKKSAAGVVAAERLTPQTSSDPATVTKPSSGVNLGKLYAYPRPHEKSPVFRQPHVQEKPAVVDERPLHLAIVVLRRPQSLSDDVLAGIGLTLTQLNRLGLHSVVVIDSDETGQDGAINDAKTARTQMLQESDRVVQAIRQYNDKGGRVVNQALSWQPVQHEIPSRIQIHNGIDLTLRDLLLRPLSNGIIPVIPTIAYDQDCCAKNVGADEVVLALSRSLNGIVRDQDTPSTSNARKPVVDRVIVLDPVGGLPKDPVTNAAHIFVNLEEEYAMIHGRLEVSAHDEDPSEVEAELPTASSSGNPFTRFMEDEFKPQFGSANVKSLITTPIGTTSQHIKNLDLVRQVLAILPPSASALVTTPAEAASSATANKTQSAVGVGTRPRRNPLIHNLLTDRPVVSSSLPSARLGSDETHGQTAAPVATFFKRGMPLTMVPNPFQEMWTPPTPMEEVLRLEKDTRIDFPRLLHLIEDSFGRKLDVQSYLKRIEGIIAGVIVAGSYEGGAILTWEHPPSYPNHAPVPYLDKFAVLRKAQGSGGVADIVFNAMVRTCFPDGVVWRSRADNPVNKWYFERATGTFKIPGSNWCMFWTGEVQTERWLDYVDVCRSIQATWLDTKKAPD